MAFPILGTPQPEFSAASGSPFASGTLSVLVPADDTNKRYYPTAADADADTNSATGDITLNSRGAISNALFGVDDETYKLVLKDSTGTTIWTETDIRLPTRLPTLYGKTAQTLTDAGGVTITESTTFIVTTTASALTLIDGVENQEKFLVMKTLSGTATLTPTNLSNGTTLVFDKVGHSAHLVFINASWNFVGGTAKLDGYDGKFESVTSFTNTLLASESGTTYMLNLAGGGSTVLPAPALGLNFKFIVATAPTTAYTIDTNGGSNIMSGTHLDIVGELVYGTARDILSFVANTSLIGDNCAVVSDGTNWYYTALGGADGAITTGQT